MITWWPLSHEYTSGVVRSSPDLAPVVVRRRTLRPKNGPLRALPCSRTSLIRVCCMSCQEVLMPTTYPYVATCIQGAVPPGLNPDSGRRVETNSKQEVARESLSGDFTPKDVRLSSYRPHRHESQGI